MRVVIWLLATPVEATPILATPVISLATPVKSNPVVRTGVATTPDSSLPTQLEATAVIASPVARDIIGWKTEDGRILGPSQRIHPIRLAQDALSKTEEAVYDVLWGPKTQSADRNRLITIGQSELSREARLTPKNAKLAVERLIAKGFVEVAVPANVNQKRQPTQYRVYSYAAVLDRLRTRNRTHIVRIVSGVFFAIPLSTPVDSLSTPVVTAPAGKLTTAVDTTPVDRLPTPVGSLPTPVVTSLPTPVATGTPSLDINSDTTTTSDLRQIAAAVRENIGVVDDDVVRRIFTECRRRAPDAEVEEITEFIRQKARLAMRNPQIRNPSGFLITAVPLCFEGESFRIFRLGREEARRLRTGREPADSAAYPR